LKIGLVLNLASEGYVRRRDFIKVIVGSAAAWPLAARAQQGEGVRRIGVLMARKIDDPEGQKQFAALREGLAERGWSEGKTFHIEARWRVGDAAETLKFAHELVRSKSEVLVAYATPSLVAMRQVTSTIPIVFVSVADPVGQGFVPSLARPGGNITGFSAEEASMGGKWLELLKELAPRVKRIAIIYNPETAPYGPMFVPAMQAAAPRMAVALSISPVHTVAEIEQVVAGAGREPGGGLIVLPDSFTSDLRQQVVALTAKHHLPAMYAVRFFVTGGGLISYGIDRVDMFHRTADYVDRILRGASPVELPVQQPTKFELAINLKTAKALGLDVPLQLQQRADEVIE
jgi:putative tryptophan/tyrosine transport system substrate-binding protein